MMYQQVFCVDRHTPVEVLVPTESATSAAEMLVWVESGRVKIGDLVTFKETGDKEWRVVRCYSTLVSHVNRGWGLELPKSQRTER